MDLPKNHFKAALKSGKHQLGFWNSIGGNTVPEILAACGYDWVMVDTEHSPVEVVDILPALQAIAGYPDVSAVVRPAINDPVLIKRILDMGAQTLLIPYVQSAEEAKAAVSAMRYPPAGIRGVAGVTRASRFGKATDYVKRASEELCLLVQVETKTALDRLEEIASVDGVDGVFIGPADLSASLGYPGEPNHPDVIRQIEGAYKRLADIGVPSGVLTLNEDFARRSMELGTAFTAIGVDLAVVVDGVTALRDRFS
ncbi:4-hydroxy-2-oxo-heptane-1,7-dioate aldolase [Stappia sp. GBMRC 2046]|uniref:4-hydroxy-2-oxo-heptane-1,7-dioate aldolase n=1 Tax=Stappia sediminis TaxID=2692190 RepID=A0A7X3LRU2_9HYPH|nr:HpcH/HpaI aldolase/citrate lyase family protein [Stappia sediminis]MXN63938.1 4-hydroxy-2-oxo-heptane-1,7-dioate aldolase [Stappia sediminis]